MAFFSLVGLYQQIRPVDRESEFLRNSRILDILDKKARKHESTKARRHDCTKGGGRYTQATDLERAESGLRAAVTLAARARGDPADSREQRDNSSAPMIGPRVLTDRHNPGDSGNQSVGKGAHTLGHLGLDAPAFDSSCQPL